MAAGGVLAPAFPALPFAGSASRERFKAIAFDAFPVFDRRPITALAESQFPGVSQTLMSLWRSLGAAGADLSGLKIRAP